MFKSFGNEKAVFVNQDEGMFVALPITLDTTTHTLETESRGGRTYAKAGSVVKEGTSVRGILAEEYDVTEGTAFARIVVEGYAWASRLTPNALTAAPNLPHIVVMPYHYIAVELGEIDTTAHTVKVIAKEGAKFASTFSGSDITATTTGGATLAYAVNTDGDTLTITASAATKVTVSAFAASAFIGSPSGSLVKGLSLVADV